MTALEGGPRALAILPGGRWIGFELDAGVGRLASAPLDAENASADLAEASSDDLLALAEIWFTGALPEPTLDGAATQQDLAQLVSALRASAVDEFTATALSLVVDAIDDGLAPDAVANLLSTARGPSAVDPLTRVVARARALGWMPSS